MRDRVDRTTEQTAAEQSRLRCIAGKCRIPLYLLLSVAVWFALWQYEARKLGNPVLLPYPRDVWKALGELLRSAEFTAILFGSLKHIATGFAMALVCGCVLAVICRFSDFAEMLLLPPMKLVKTVPVVSFIILLLLWVDPARISIVISFLIVLPVVYANVSRGIRETSPELLEMARVFHIPFLRRLRYLYMPNTVPYATAAVSTGLSLCWKAGIAAEIIGLSKDSIGRQLYDAKLYLDTANLFAWTVVVILVSVLMEWTIMVVFRAAAVSVTDPTLWYRPRQALRFLIGLPVREEKPTEEPVSTGNVADDASDAASIANDTPAVSDDTSQPLFATPDDAVQSASATSDAAKQPVSANGGAEAVVELRSVSKSFNGRSVLENVSVSLHRGEILLITGPSGGGKTTMLRCMLGLVRPDSGAVEYPSGKPCMAAVFQEDRLCAGLPAWKNVAIALPGRTKRDRRQQILDDLAVLGIDDGARKPVKAFSGGMKRRVAWLRALSVKPDLLVLDEPFTGLDAVRKELLLELLRSLSNETAIAIVTHNTSEIEKIYAYFKNVVRVNQGA